jgi:hypothetical protein
MNRYSHNLFEVLRSVYPEHQWNEWRFTVPAGHWNEPENRKRFIEWAASQLGIQQLKDWYKVSKHDALIKLGGAFCPGSIGTLTSCLTRRASSRLWTSEDIRRFTCQRTPRSVSGASVERLGVFVSATSCAERA